LNESGNPPPQHTHAAHTLPTPMKTTNEQIEGIARIFRKP